MTKLSQRFELCAFEIEKSAKFLSFYLSLKSENKFHNKNETSRISIA